ncbi:MAG: hypothetical protein IJ551_09025 [Prevotella sp.]|nr:hypothetical protein [Prevotella sp.]
MKRIKTYTRLGLTAVVAAVLAAGCSEAEELALTGDGCETATLTLTLPGHDLQTRADATDPGVDELNENLIQTVDLFFYPTGQTDQNAVVHKRLEGSGAVSQSGTVATLQASIGIGELRQMFLDYDDAAASNQACEVYAIVNLPQTSAIPANTDVASLQQIELASTEFYPTKQHSGDASFQMNVTPDNFVMSGQTSQIGLADDKRSIVGNIDVYRAASKVTIELTDVAPIFTDEKGIEWESQNTAITVSLKHGQTVGYVDAPDLHTVAGDFTSKNILMTSSGTGDNGKEHYTTDVPLYTYPNKWSSDASHRTSITVCVPWRKKGETNFTRTFYEIPINDEDEQLLRNTHYKLSLSIGIIGSLEEEDPVLLYNCSYVILPWGTNSTITATLQQVRYLVVNEDSVVMNNTISRDIYFSSSHKLYYGNTLFNDAKYGTLKVYNKHLYHRDLRSTDAKWEEVEPASDSNPYDGNGFRVVINQSNDPSVQSFLTIEHDLDNSGGADADYTQYKMEFYVYHYDQEPTDTKYIQKIVAIQNPMVYAEADPNSHYPQTSASDGNVFVNGYRTTEDYYYTPAGSYGGSWGLSGNNKNPNRYRIYATTLTDNKYVIGDPRLLVVNNALTGTNITTASTSVADWSEKTTNNLYNEGKTRYAYNWRNGYYNTSTTGDYRTLQFYHPTEESDRTSSMIAPEFMIASSYGVTDAISKENARKRCASYQEDGYPAGRWRLPTSAEVEYIVQLSAYQIIPVLFGSLPTGNNTSNSTDYWSANGRVTVAYNQQGDGTVTLTSTTNNNLTYYVRCVYDTWYWSDKCDENTFTWGDKSTF